MVAAMTDTNDQLHPALPTADRAADEVTTLVEKLDYYRAVLARKASGLTSDQLARTLGPSTLTIGGLIYHMALVEDIWFHEGFAGNDAPEPWASVDWEADHDWELNTARLISADDLLAQYDESIARSRAVVAGANSLDQIMTKVRADGEHINLRWILVHMIEEYARHCGHADLLRQSIDGVVDD